MAAIRESKKYDRFEVTSFNRDVKEVRRLKVLMKREGWANAYPMDVRKKENGKLLIVSGHHRFVAAQELGIPVKYVIDNHTMSIHEMEGATRTWSIMDFLVSHIRSGSAPHMAVKDFVDRTGIPLSIAISLMAGKSANTNQHNEVFKNGAYRIGDTSHAELIGDLVLFCKEQGVSFATHSFFVKALSKVSMVDVFSPEQFKKKIKSHGHLFQKRPDIDGFTEELEKIYNIRVSAKDKIPLKFLAEQAALGRIPEVFRRENARGRKRRTLNVEHRTSN